MDGGFSAKEGGPVTDGSGDASQADDIPPWVPAPQRARGHREAAWIGSCDAWAAAFAKLKTGLQVGDLPPEEHYALLRPGLFEGMDEVTAQEEAEWVVRYWLHGRDLSSIAPRGPAIAKNWGVVAPLWLRANAPMVVAEVCSTMKYPKRSQYKHAKQKKYHVRNWAEYNEGLRRRGDLTVWFDEEAIANWKADKTGKPGGQRVYSDLAIETSLVVRMVYKLAYRQTEGFLNSIASLLGLGIEIPDYSTLCRRSRLLRKKLRIPKAASSQPIHLMIDSTGLRIHVGTARKPPKQRAWRKLHIAVDRKTGNIVASELTASRARDATRVPALLTQIQAPLVSVAADSAYDKEAVYETIEAHSPGRRTRVVIPPQRNATLSQNSNTAMQERDRHIRAIERHGRREWYKLSGCTKRSMVENAVYRYKAIIGPEMRTRTLARQRVEHRIGCEILNKVTALGMPDTYCAG